MTPRYKRSLPIRAHKGRQKLSWFQRNESSLKFGLTFLGFLLGVNEYLQRQHDSRVQRSLAIYERFQSDSVIEARLGIDRLWNSRTFWEELISRRTESGTIFWDDISDLAVIATSNRDIVDDLYVVWAISSEASLCLSRGQCDQVTICQSFWHDAQKYYYFFQPYFSARAIAWDETVQNIEATSNSVLEEHCGNKKYRELYSDKDDHKAFDKFRKKLRRYLFESFNVPVINHER